MTVTRPPGPAPHPDVETTRELDALFREARRLRRRRWILGLGILAVAAGTGAGADLSTAAPGRQAHSSSATSHRPPGGATVGVCRATQLSVAFVRSDVAMGTATTVFAFTNEGRTCRIRGFPTVDLLTATGANLPTTQREVNTSDALPPRTVVLARGAQAYFVILYPDGTGFTGLHCPESAALRITPPEQSSSIIVRGEHGHIRAFRGEHRAPALRRASGDGCVSSPHALRRSLTDDPVAHDDASGGGARTTIARSPLQGGTAAPAQTMGRSGRCRVGDRRRGSRDQRGRFDPRLARTQPFEVDAVEREPCSGCLGPLVHGEPASGTSGQFRPAHGRHHTSGPPL